MSPRNSNKEKRTPVPNDSEREPEHEPNRDPRSGQHDPDIQGEKSKRKRNNQPQPPDRTGPEEDPGKEEGEFGDGDPVEEKSPRIPGIL
jgi:hypothetical protein